jgi:putative Holliday junction resolvase
MSARPGGRVLALDVGTRRVGVAVSDETATIARPFAVLAASPRRALWRGLARAIAELSPAEILVGLPRRLDGSPGSLAPEAERLAAGARSRFGLPVIFRDESLTTAEAAAALRESGASRTRGRAPLDAAAAAVLLQGYLDERRRAR